MAKYRKIKEKKKQKTKQKHKKTRNIEDIGNIRAVRGLKMFTDYINKR